MSGWVYFQIALQAFVAVGALLVAVIAANVVHDEYRSGRLWMAIDRVILVVFGAGIALASAPFLFDSIQNAEALIYLAEGGRFGTFPIARYLWSIGVFLGVFIGWKYFNRRPWYIALVSITLAVPVGLTLWVVWTAYQ